MVSHVKPGTEGTADSEHPGPARVLCVRNAEAGHPPRSEAAFQAVQDLAAFPVVQIDPPLILLAIQRSRKAKVSFWDALILEAALAAGTTRLYSEDFQDGAVFGGLRIANLFKLSV